MFAFVLIHVLFALSNSKYQRFSIATLSILQVAFLVLKFIGSDHTASIISLHVTNESPMITST